MVGGGFEEFKGLGRGFGAAGGGFGGLEKDLGEFRDVSGWVLGMFLGEI